MPHTPLPSVHNPSPYLRRYRLPKLHSSIRRDYDEPGSPNNEFTDSTFIPVLDIHNRLNLSDHHSEVRKQNLVRGNSGIEKSAVSKCECAQNPMFDDGDYYSAKQNISLTSEPITNFKIKELSEKCRELLHNITIFEDDDRIL